MTLTLYIMIGLTFSLGVTTLGQWLSTKIDQVPEYDTWDAIMFIVLWPIFLIVFIISLINTFRD